MLENDAADDEVAVMIFPSSALGRIPCPATTLLPLLLAWKAFIYITHSPEQRQLKKERKFNQDFVVIDSSLMLHTL